MAHVHEAHVAARLADTGGAHRFVVFETILGALPAIITAQGPRSPLASAQSPGVVGSDGLFVAFDHRVSYLATADSDHFDNGPPASPDKVNKMLSFLDSCRTKAEMVSAVLLRLLGGSLLLWLRSAARRI